MSKRLPNAQEWFTIDGHRWATNNSAVWREDVCPAMDQSVSAWVNHFSSLEVDVAVLRWIKDAPNARYRLRSVRRDTVDGKPAYMLQYNRYEPIYIQQIFVEWGTKQDQAWSMTPLPKAPVLIMRAGELVAVIMPILKD